MKIGVLALQGAVSEHIRSLEAAGADEVIPVKRKEQLEGLDGLVIPGGESTTIGKLLREYDMLEPIREMAQQGTPMFGTCAGLIILAKDIQGADSPHVGVMDITVNRNSFGRQVDSFEADLEVKGIEGEPYRAVFIRAPHIISTGPDVEVISQFDDRIVAARQGHLLGTSFHPELTDDIRLHEVFVDMIRSKNKA